MIPKKPLFIAGAAVLCTSIAGAQVSGRATNADIPQFWRRVLDTSMGEWASKAPALTGIVDDRGMPRGQAEQLRPLDVHARSPPINE